MAKLIYSAISSLDGFVADEEGKFDWGEPDEEVHSFINDLDREVGTYLYGRRMYEVMIAWEDVKTDDQPHLRDFAEIWRGATRSCTRRRWMRSRHPERGSNATSTPRWFRGSKCQRNEISA